MLSEGGLLSNDKHSIVLQVLTKDTICHTLSLMHSCGMYDSAGEFSFAVSGPRLA